MMPLRLPVAAIVLAVALGACGEPPQATPVPTLPALERPVAQLGARQGGNVLVPQRAVIERGGIPGVFVLADGQARFRMVKTGRRQGERIEILSGLTGTETLVLGDLTPVHDGSPIRRSGG